MMRFLFFFFTFVPFIFAECPEKSVKWRSNCYFFEDKITAFIKAELYCNNLGGHLASVHDGFTNAFLAQYGILTFNSTATPDFWVGVTDMINPGNWSWTDGSWYSFSEWKTTNNKTFGETCGAVNVFDARWDIDECFNAKPFVCETKENVTLPNPQTTTTTPKPVTSTTTVLSSPSPIGNCSNKEWVYFQGFCYLLTPTQPSWKSAESYCVSNESSHLVSIKSDDELLFVQNLRPQLYKWIGLYSDGNLLQWKWTDGTSVNYTPWASGLPENGNSTCVTAYNEFRNDFGCDGWNLYAVCKKVAVF